jgi:predicted ATPase
MAVKIVITGGPSGGKTTLIEALQREMGSVVAVVPEAASILYRGGFPRIKSAAGLRHGQKAIYAVQRELEELVDSEHPKVQLIICDRGSLDSIAYWPQPESHFFKALKTSRRKELARYQWVIHLDTASRPFYDTTNPIRTESFNEATLLNERIKKAWSDHPHRLIITQNEDFLSKMTLSLEVIRAILEGHSLTRIHQELLAPD